MTNYDLKLKCPECGEEFQYTADLDHYCEKIVGLEGDYTISCPHCYSEEIEVTVEYFPYFRSKHEVKKQS